MRRILSALTTTLLLLAVPAIVHTEDGMYLLQQLPSERWQAEYGVEINDETVDQWMRSAVKLVGVHGCSGSFVSSTGLILTAHHCIADNSAKVITLKDGYCAPDTDAEKHIPGLTIQYLRGVNNVTEKIAPQLSGLTGTEFSKAERNAKTSVIDAELHCADKAHAYCEVIKHVSVDGESYLMYIYERVNDVRLVFAPELDAGRFGGEVDNFRLRPDADFAFIRIWPDGHVPSNVVSFTWSLEGVKPGDTTLLLGHPGMTHRQLFSAQLSYHRNTVIPWNINRFSERRGVLIEFLRQHPEAAALAENDLLFADNFILVYKAMLARIGTPGFIESRHAEEQALQERISNPELRQKYVAALDELNVLMARKAQLIEEHALLETGHGFWSDLFTWARSIVRWHEEKKKPNSERLEEYREERVTVITDQLFASSPFNRELEIAKLNISLAMLRQQLGSDHSAVVAIFGKESPVELATRVVNNTRLAEVGYRRKLWEQLDEDSMIDLARRAEPYARKSREVFNDEVEGKENATTRLIAETRKTFGIRPKYPDATSTIRANIGRVQGFEENGRHVGQFSMFADAFARHTGRVPFSLPESWLVAKDKLNKDMPLCFSTTNDIIGGFSGSPVLSFNDNKWEVAGVAYDGNRSSAGNAYSVDANDRAIVVSTQAIDHALRVIYNASNLADQLGR